MDVDEEGGVLGDILDVVDKRARSINEELEGGHHKFRVVNAAVDSIGVE